MKHLRYVIIAAAVLVTACTNDFEEINTNPNKINYGEIQAYNCFEPLLYGIGRYEQDYNSYYNNELIQTTAFTSGATSQIHVYYITAGNWQSIWDCYARFGNDANHMIQLAEKTGDKYFEGVGRVLKSYCLANLSFLFGDIPFKEAYKLSENRTPAFESQEDVIADIITDLDSAAVLMASKPTPFGTGLDKMYNDTPANWRKFANSLKMRLLCQMSGINDSYWKDIQKMIDNPQTYPVFKSNDDNASVPFQDTDPYMSDWGVNKVTEDSYSGHRFTERFISMLAEFDENLKSTLVDPRLPIFGTQRQGEWKGTLAGYPVSDNSTIDAGTSYPNYYTSCRASMPAFLMDYSEILFIEAEGVERGKLTVTGQTAKSLYEAAVQSSIDKWSEFGKYAKTPVTVRPSEVAKFMDSSLASYDKAAAENGSSIYSDALELILSQKYISLYTCAFNQYNEWRRTEYPVLTIGYGCDVNNYELPTRMGYPNYTVSSNSAHVNEALTRMGGDNNMHTTLDWSYAKLNGGKHRNPYVAE